MYYARYCVTHTKVNMDDGAELLIVSQRKFPSETADAHSLISKH